MEALIAAIATVIVALIGLVGVFVESTRRSVVESTEINRQDHESTMLLLHTAIKDLGGLKSEVRTLTNRFNEHLEKD